MSAAAGNVGGDGRRQVGSRDVVDLHRALVLLAELLCKGREPPIIVGDEMLPLHDAECPLLLRGGFAQKNGGDRGCSRARRDAFQDAPAAQLPLLLIVHEPSLRVVGRGTLVQQPFVAKPVPLNLCTCRDGAVVVVIRCP